MYTRLTGQALNGSVTRCTRSHQDHLGLRGEHHLPVHARRLASSIALRHPPHTQERVSARTKHQLLQVTDPLQVPRPTCREDPLAQTPYALLTGTPINSVPVENLVLWSVHPAYAWRPTCPSVPVPSSSSSSQAHLTASAPFQVRALCPVSGQLCGTTSWRGQPSCPGFLLPFGCRHSLLGHPIPARGLGLPYGRLTGPKPGPRRGYHVPHVRAATGVGAPCTPRTAVLTRLTLTLSAGAYRFSTASPYTPRNIPSAGLRITRHQRRFTQFTRPVFPSPVAPGWNRSPWASPPSFGPRRLITDDARQGGDRP